MRASAEGKTVSDAFAKALSRLEDLVGEPIDREEVEVIVISEGSKGFLGMGSAMAKVEVRLPREETAEGDASAAAAGEETGERSKTAAEAHRRLREYLEMVLDSLGLEGRVDITEKEEELIGKVDGSDLGLFIGRHGQTLDAIQYLANVIVYRKLADRRRVVIDAEDYRDRRAETLQALADRGAGEVLKGRSRYELKPMSAAERRIIHLHLQDRDGVETLSEGNEPFRRVVIVRAGGRP